MFYGEPGITAGVVMAGTAIGAAFLVDVRPLAGADGWAGELGYLPIGMDAESEGTDFRVARLDDLAGGASIAARCGLTPEALGERARSGDPSVLAVVHRAGCALGVGLAAVINLMNPRRLAVGGGALRLTGYWAAAQASAQQHSLPLSWRSCSLTRVQAGEHVVALGARRLAEQQLQSSTF